MPRNTTGVYTPPGSYPPAAGSVIDLDAYKALVSDVVAELTDSLSRSGKGDMTAALRLVNGSTGVPALSFTSNSDTGLALSGSELQGIIDGAIRSRLSATGLVVAGTLQATGGLADDTSHGVRGGGFNHAEATTSVAGFLSADDKTLLDTVRATNPAETTGTFSFLSGWETDPVATPVLRKKSGIVSLTFTAKCTNTSFTDIGLLPAGYRPTREMRLVMQWRASGVNSVVIFSTSGHVQVSGRLNESIDVHVVFFA